jgi:hypothetical protein
MLEGSTMGIVRRRTAPMPGRQVRAVRRFKPTRRLRARRKLRAGITFTQRHTQSMATCFWPRADKMELSSPVRRELEGRRAAWEKQRWAGQRALAVVGFGGILLGFSVMEWSKNLPGLLSSLSFMFGCTMLLLHSMSQSVRDKGAQRAPWAHWLGHLPTRDLGTCWLDDPALRRKLLKVEPDRDTLDVMRSLAPDFAGPISQLEIAARHLVAEPATH